MVIGGRGTKFSAKREQDGGYWARVGIIGESACWRLCCGRHNRHTFGTWLRQQGVELDVIASQLGHRDLRMTERYARIASAQVRQAVSGLDSMLGAAEQAEVSNGCRVLVGDTPIQGLTH